MSDPWAAFRAPPATDHGQNDAWAAFRAQPKVSTLEDVGRSIMSNGLQGAAEFMGSVGDLAQAAQEMPTHGLQFLEDKGILPRGTAAEFRRQAQAHPFNALVPKPAYDAGRAVIFQALQSAGVPHDRAQDATRLLPGGPNLLPTTRDIEAAVGAKGDPDYNWKAETLPGKYAGSVARYAPAALLPGSVPAKVANVVAPGLANEAAGQLTEGTPMEPWARLAAATLAGGAAQLLNQPAPATRMLADASHGATDAEIMAATRLREDAAQRGIHLTLAEAVQQVTDNGTRLGTMQRVLEGTRAGSELTTPYMAERPQQVQGAVSRFADTIAPPGGDPYVLAGDTRAASGEVMSQVRQATNANARPWYEALRDEAMPTAAPQYQELLADPAYQAGLREVRGNPILNRDFADLPDHSLAVVDKVVSHLREMATNAAPHPTNPNGSMALASAYDQAAARADELASAVSEPYRLARSMVASGREAFLEPLQMGPMGSLSHEGLSPNLQAQTRALFPSAPAEGAAPATAQTLEMLPQEVAAPLVRHHIVNTANEAMQNLQSGQNQWGGAKLAAVIAGNPEQAATLREGVRAVGGDVGNLDGLIQALQATGKRQAPGSLTAYNAEELRNLGSMGAAGETAKTIATVPSMFRRFGEMLERAQMERNARAIAEVLLSDPAEGQARLLDARRAVPAAIPSSAQHVAMIMAQSRPN